MFCSKKNTSKEQKATAEHSKTVSSSSLAMALLEHMHKQYADKHGTDALSQPGSPIRTTLAEMIFGEMAETRQRRTRIAEYRFDIEPDVRGLRPPPVMPWPALADYGDALLYDDDPMASAKIATDKRHPITLDTDISCPILANPGLDKLLT
jgi:hypothetical protein